MIHLYTHTLYTHSEHTLYTHRSWVNLRTHTVRTGVQSEDRRENEDSCREESVHMNRDISA